MSVASAYAAITPARDEVDNLPRLAEALLGQTLRPSVWVIVDNGSTDGTAELALTLAAEHEWIRPIAVPGVPVPERGGAVVRAFQAGLKEVGDVDVVVNLDADVSFTPEFFTRLLRAFAEDPRLGIASGSGYELEGSEWRQRHLTGSTVWGATRAYRRACLADVLPLEERLGWDGIDEFKANVRGWRTRTLTDLPFRHHRAEGDRDGAWQSRTLQGDVAHYMGYRPSYIFLRALFNLHRDLAAPGLAWGYIRAVARRSPRLSDAAAVEYARTQQRLRNLPRRAAEALGRRA